MPDLILRLLTALSIGLLVGLERGWRERDEADGQRAAGLRTFGISGLLGGVLAALSATQDSPVIFAAGLLAFSAIFAWFHLREATRMGSFSVTSVVAGLCVFALGGLAVLGDQSAAAAAAAGLAAILASREVLHASLRRLTWEELRSAVVLAVMTMIVLPLLPNRALDPWGGFNPHEVWLFTVLIAAISFVGYIAVRALGPQRGPLVSGLLGALVSSTAVTMAFARMAQEKTAAQGLIRALCGASALAAMVSLLRVLAVITVIRPALLTQIAPPVMTAATVFGGFGLMMTMQGRSVADPKPTQDGANLDVPARNPFEIKALIVFGGLFALVSTIGAALAQAFGNASLYIASVLAGSLDVDVAALSAMRTPNATESAVTFAILAALAANAIARLGLAATLSSRRFWLPLGAITAIALTAGGSVLLMIAA